jgi:hypothetical protein
MAAHGGSARTDRGEGDDGGAAERPAPTSFEYRSRFKIAGLPLVHVVRGIDPSSGRRPPAVGLIAVGQVAVGLIAIGQVAIGVISVGQAAVGLGWGIGQLAFGLLAAGQVAAGLLGAIGQVAASPHAFGMVSSGGAWVVVGWLLGGIGLFAALNRRRRRLAPLLAPRAPRIADVRDGSARVTAEVISLDCLKAPLSSRECVFWHAVSVGPAGREHERAGGEIRIGDGSGTARVDLGAEVIFIRSDDYREMVGPDWALHLETSLARGDQLHVAGPVALGPDTSNGGVLRHGAISPLFSGRRGAPVIVSTRDPAAIRAELQFAACFAWALLGGAALAATRWMF